MLWIAIGALLFLSVYSLFIEPRRFIVRNHKINRKGDKKLSLRILHISDFHFYQGQKSRKKFLHWLANNVEVDFIFLTGDLIDEDNGIDLCIEAFAPLNARYGIYCVLGNHDYYYVSAKAAFHKTGDFLASGREPNDTERLKQGLKQLGITVLNNSRVTVPIDDTEITIAGLDDPYLLRHDISTTFDDFQKNGPCFLLSHTPEPYQELSDYDIDMVFSGHTHGGQIRIPGFGPIVTRINAPRKFAYGLNQVSGTMYYTSCGIGSSKLTPPRFWCPPEAVIFNIHIDPS